MVKNDESLEEIEKFVKEDTNRSTTYEITHDKNITVKLSSSIDIITPGLNVILDNPYEVSASRVIYEE